MSLELSNFMLKEEEISEGEKLNTNFGNKCLYTQLSCLSGHWDGCIWHPISKILLITSKLEQAQTVHDR